MLQDLDPQQDLWHTLINEHSLIIEEGHYRLAEEFGPEHGVYFSILAALASGKTSRPELESLLEMSIGPYLERLEQEFDIIQRQRPIFASAQSRLVRYQLKDAFLSFWFRFIYRYRSTVEIGNYDFIRQVIARDYATYSGHWLERLVREAMADQGYYSRIGSYWERGNRNEIDLVAVNELDKTALIAEIKRNSANIRLSRLKEKAGRLQQKLKGYEIEFAGLSLTDLPQLVDSQGRLPWQEMTEH